MNMNGNKKITRKAPLFALALLMALSFPMPGSYASKGMGNASAINGPLQQSMIIRLSIESVFRGIKVPVMVYLPKGYGGGEKYPVWYGMHGYSSTENMWLQYAGIGRKADEMIESGEIRPLIMVFPLTKYDSAKAIQEDMKDGKRDASQMERFLCEELLPYIDDHYDTPKSPDGRYIGGFSMGAYFALEIGFRHPDLFYKVGAFDPALRYSDFSGRQLEQWMYPYDNATKIDDAAAFAKHHGFDRLQVYLDCGGADDPFSQGAQSLYEAFQARGIHAKFQMYEGGHSLRLGQIGEYLLFFSGRE